MYRRLLKVDPLKCILCGSQIRFTGLKWGVPSAELVLMHEPLGPDRNCAAESRRGEVTPIFREMEQKTSTGIQYQSMSTI